MITLAQARKLAELINDYTAASIRMREFGISAEDYNAAKRAMSNYISALVDPMDALLQARSVQQARPVPVSDDAEKKRQRRNFLARQRRAHKK